MLPSTPYLKFPKPLKNILLSLRFLIVGSFVSCSRSFDFGFWNLLVINGFRRSVNPVNKTQISDSMTELTATPETFWSSLRDNLLEVIPADTFRVWFDNIRVGRLDEDGCELITPNEFSAIWIRDNYLDVIRQEADRLVGYPFTVELLGAFDEEEEQDANNRIKSTKVSKKSTVVLTVRL